MHLWLPHTKVPVAAAGKKNFDRGVFYTPLEGPREGRRRSCPKLQRTPDEFPRIWQWLSRFTLVKRKTEDQWGPCLVTVRVCVKPWSYKLLRSTRVRLLEFYGSGHRLDATTEHVKNAKEEKLLPDHKCDAGSGSRQLHH